MYLKKVLFFLCVVFSVSLYAQVSGIVVDTKGKPIWGVNVYLKQAQKGSETQEDGKFFIQVNKKTHKDVLVASFVGFKAFSKSVTINQNGKLYVKIILAEDDLLLDDVVINAKSEGQILKEKAFEVAVLETKGIKNITANVNTVLKGISGVNIRESGGLGSSFQFSMNGLSGKQIKFFIDDIPIDNLGSTMNFNNFPVNLIERAEIYKGVVPIHLGADALGGAVNIITKQQNTNYIDASYSLGSFNTHIGSLLGQYFDKKTGFVAKLTSFYNSSKNNYTIDGLAETDNYGNFIRTLNNKERFHDAYQSAMLNVQAGVVDKSFADKLMVGSTFSSNKDEVQHSQEINAAYGGLHTKEELNQLFLIYNNSKLLDSKLNLKLYGSLNKNVFKRVDTVSLKYSWSAPPKLKDLNEDGRRRGELSSERTIFQITDKSHLLNTSLTYEVNQQHKLGLNYSKNYLKRRGAELLNTQEEYVPFEKPHIVDKHILGISYDFNFFDKKWKNSLFSKYYNITSEGVFVEEFLQKDDPNRYKKISSNYVNYGYGFATTYKLSRSTRLKSSFENSYRLPEGYEMFGDGLFLLPNVTLKPEQSFNINFGGVFEKQITDNFRFNFELNGFYRKAKDLISLQGLAIYQKYINRSKANVLGIEVGTKLKYKNFELRLNATKQEVTEKQGEKRVKVPNIAFLFANGQISYKKENLFKEDDAFGVSLITNYTNEFPYQSYTSGAKEERFYVDTQLTHNFETNYSFSKGKYNVSMMVNNLLDASVFDNYNIQKPGRSYYLKLRFYIDNF